ncbi:pentapeptide repeat-containing protein [Rickettsiella endosymbiont of Aleochara curtula]|uniref:pentapeptide repeat-containing protein n=1 Tax=Rickettsiella endosymbiont of Aleochara curtula TaxID=3077936 RepID=UPI00313DC305
MQRYYYILDQLNLPSVLQLKTYLINNTEKLSAFNQPGNTDKSTAELSAELFKLFLTGLELKTFKGWDLRAVNFTQINAEFSRNNNQTNDATSLFKNLDLSNANLENVELSHLDFSESNFIGTNLKYSTLKSMRLVGSDMTRADLTQADLSQATLNEVIFKKSILKRANLKNCQLRKANLEKADLQRCQLDNADLREANFSDCDLGDASLAGTNAQDVNFSRAILKNASLYFANLSRANFRGANLDQANLSGSNKTDINIEGTSINQVSIPYDQTAYFEWEDIKSLSYRKYPARYTLSPQQSTQDKSIGLALMERCLPVDMPRAIACKISWADVDIFTFDGQYTCDVKEIVINGQSFLWYLKYKDEATQSQWLYLADVVNVTTQAQTTIKDLIHFQKLSPMLNTAMLEIESKARDLKNSSSVDNLSVTTPSSLEFDFSESQNIMQPNPIYVSLNSTLFNVNTVTTQKNAAIANRTLSYDVSFDFLSTEIQALLGIIKSISIYKWPSAPETIFFYQLTPETHFNEQQIASLTGTLNRTQYTPLLQKFPDVFTRCEQSCWNVTLSDNDVLRHTLIQLVNSVSSTKAIVSFSQNLSSILPNRHILQFTDNTKMMFAKEKNWLAETINNQTLAALTPAYTKLAKRLNISMTMLNPVTNELLNIGDCNHQILQNHPVHISHLVDNSHGKKFVISGGPTLLTQNHFPLPNVTLYATSKGRYNSLLDFRPLAKQIKQDFNASLAILLLKKDNDIILKRSLIISKNETFQFSVPVISVRLKNARSDHWYRNLKIIPNTATTQLTLHGINLQLTPLPLQLKVNAGSTDFISVHQLESNSRIFIPRTIDHHSFFYNGEDLVLTNAYTPNLEINQLCNIVLEGFHQELEKGLSFSLEFTNQKIVLLEEAEKIRHAASSWNQSLHQYKNTLFRNAYQQGQLPSSSLFRDDCYNPIIFYIDTDANWERKRRSISIIPLTPAPSVAAPTASNSVRSTGMLQTSVKTIKESVKWLSDKMFSATPSTHDKPWETAYNYYVDYDRGQLKQQKARLIKKKIKQAHITTAIAPASTHNKQAMIATTPYKQELTQIKNRPKAARLENSSQQKSEKISVNNNSTYKSNPTQQHQNKPSNTNPDKNNLCIAAPSFFNTNVNGVKSLEWREQSIRKELAGSHAHHQQSKPTKGLSQATASSNSNEMLFAFTFLAKCMNKESRTHINPKIKHAQQQLDRQTYYKIPGQPLGMGIPR